MKTMFDPTYMPYSSKRFPVTSKNGMVITGSNIASDVGIEILKKGGNAVDAAIAVAAALTIVEPQSNAIGSDAFCIVWIKDKLYGLNSSGYSPKEISKEKVLEKSIDGKIPTYGWTPVTIPGAPKAWVKLNEKFGKLSLMEDLAPAIKIAEEGFAIPPIVGVTFKEKTEAFNKIFKGKSEFNEWFRVYTKDGKPFEFGDILKLPDHAKTLRLIAETNGDAIYKGEIADKIVSQSKRDGGYITKSDLEEYDAMWVEPISIEYKGYRIWELPPNCQGIVALNALNILKEFDFKDVSDVDTYHKQFEAMKIAFSDGKKYITDPNFMKIDYMDLIKPEYGKKRSLEIGDKAKLPKESNLHKSGTVYFSVGDSEGNMVSFIQSNYLNFGSGIVVEGYGVNLQNRGCDFSLDEEDENFLLPRKRTYHTIIPGFITDLDCKKAISSFGMVGGYMQPQGHVQFVMNLIDFKLNPQMVLDCPRWMWVKDLEFKVEPSFNKEAVDLLKKKGHEISYLDSYDEFGRGQMMLRLDNGVYVGGCESRTDSNIACY